jgi:hypothetical protein
LSKISPIPHATERRITIRKRRSGGREILASSPFKIKLEEKREAKIDKADQQRRRKETRGRNFLNKSQKTKNHNARKRRLKSSAQVNSKVNRSKEAECTICDESSDEDWIPCNFCHEWAHENCADKEGNALFCKRDICKAKINI